MCIWANNKCKECVRYFSSIMRLVIQNCSETFPEFRVVIRKRSMKREVELLYDCARENESGINRERGKKRKEKRERKIGASGNKWERDKERVTSKSQSGFRVWL